MKPWTGTASEDCAALIRVPGQHHAERLVFPAGVPVQATDAEQLECEGRPLPIVWRREPPLDEP